MLAPFIWYLVLLLTGWIAFPLTFRFLRSLPDHGFAFSRVLGLLLWGYIFWLLTSLGVIQNDRGGILLALGFLIVISLAAGGILRTNGFQKDTLSEIKAWLRENGTIVVILEVLFLVAFVFQAIVRSANPEVLGTEKPMELAFINAILRSPSFPPHDPWLSGYGISYYYFGYVLVAMLAKLGGTPGAVAFNLGGVTVFALCASGIFSLAYDILPRRARRLALLAPVFFLLLSNLGGLLEVIHANGAFWQPDGSGAYRSSFWSWLDIKNLSDPPQQIGITPQRYYWWWQSSRVVQDHTLSGQPLEVIDEFPAFSFILGDLHPHILSMPFTLLALALALNLLLAETDQRGVLGNLVFGISPPSLLLHGLILGSLAFLNTWDFPTYVAFFCVAYLFRRARTDDWRWQRIWEAVQLGIIFFILGVALFAPFYLGFSSQAGGILPNLVYPTRGAHLWAMFALLFVPVFIFLISNLTTGKERRPPILILAGVCLGFFLILWLLSLALGVFIGGLPDLGQVYLGSIGAQNVQEALRGALTRRFENAAGWITLLTLLILGVAFVWRLTAKTTTSPYPGTTADFSLSVEDDRSGLFIGLLVLMGTLLVIFPEFFYLRDQFGWRINTIFKFYFQAWLFFSLAAACASAILVQRIRSLTLILTVILTIGLLYFPLGVWTKTNGFHPDAGLTLDGSAFLEAQMPDDLAAARWLQSAPYGVIAEAVGGSYSEYARVATFSGLPNVLGWPGHESQWRGGAKEMGSRESDLETLYHSNRWEDVKTILDRYAIRYVVFGNLERNKYGANDNLLKRFLAPVFEQGSIKIYEVPSGS